MNLEITQETLTDGSKGLDFGDFGSINDYIDINNLNSN